MVFFGGGAPASVSRAAFLSHNAVIAVIGVVVVMDRPPAPPNPSTLLIGLDATECSRFPLFSKSRSVEPWESVRLRAVFC